MPEGLWFAQPRVSTLGYLHIPFEEYLCLLDWTGREIRADKRGSIPSNLAPILERLGIQANLWADLVSNFGRWFRTPSVGRKTSQVKQLVAAADSSMDHPAAARPSRKPDRPRTTAVWAKHPIAPR